MLANGAVLRLVLHNWGMKKFRPELQITNSTIETMLNHHSVRAYSDKPVDDATLFSILSAAQSAPTSSNQACWSVVVVRDEERRHELAKMTGSNQFITQAPVFLVWVADLSRVDRLAGAAKSPTEAFNYQEAIFLGAIDAILAAQNAAVAAESLGLGTCYVGGVRNGIEQISQYLDLPKYSFPVVGLTVGWPSANDTASTKPRMPLSGLVLEERYDVEAADSGIRTLDEESAQYREAQGRPALIWSEDAVTKWATVDWIGARANNRQILIERGFKDI